MIEYQSLIKGYEDWRILGLAERDNLPKEKHARQREPEWGG